MKPGHHRKVKGDGRRNKKGKRTHRSGRSKTRDKRIRFNRPEWAVIVMNLKANSKIIMECIDVLNAEV